MPAGEPSRKRKLSDCCPDVLRKCLRKCENSVDIRSAYPGFIGSIRVPESLQHKLSCICKHHMFNVQQLAEGEPAQLYSITRMGTCGSPCSAHWSARTLPWALTGSRMWSTCRTEAMESSPAESPTTTSRRPLSASMLTSCTTFTALTTRPSPSACRRCLPLTHHCFWQR
jgi:hypothetical protein